MAGNLKDILSNLSTDIDQETLLLYLQGQLSEEKKNEIEKKLLENEFAEEAMEGLQQFRNKKDIGLLVEQLNIDLRKKVLKKKRRREKMQLRDQGWLYISIILVLLLIVISYIVIHRYLQNQ